MVGGLEDARGKAAGYGTGRRRTDMACENRVEARRPVESFRSAASVPPTGSGYCKHPGAVMHRPSMHRLSGPLPRHAASPSHATWQGPVPLLQNSRTLVPRMVIRSGVLSRRKLPVRELLANSVSVASEGEQSDTAGRLFPVTQMGNRQRPVHRSASAASVAGLSAWAEHVSTIPHATTTASQQLRIVILRVPLRKKQPAPRLTR